VEFSQSNFIATKLDNFGGDFVPPPVEENKFIPNSHTQHVARVVCFGPD
jgi:hypothetical protein